VLEGVNDIDGDGKVVGDARGERIVLVEKAILRIALRKSRRIARSRRCFTRCDRDRVAWRSGAALVLGA
jgi:hypothetical protein